jgi:cell division protein FtsI/penicillin-binding protein 2
LAIPGFTVWWKTWTSQLSFKWKYQRWIWWTIGSFVGIATKDNLKYVIAVKVSRPRQCQWWICTAWHIFRDVAKFIIKYDGIEK